MIISKKVDEVKTGMEQSSNKLSITIQLIMLLLKLRFNLAEDTYQIISKLISHQIYNDDCEIGWEEITNANILYYLRVTLKKDSKENQIKIEKIDDFGKFKKHITFLFDKLSKGSIN